MFASNFTTNSPLPAEGIVLPPPPPVPGSGSPVPGSGFSVPGSLPSGSFVQEVKHKVVANKATPNNLKYFVIVFCFLSLSINLILLCIFSRQKTCAKIRLFLHIMTYKAKKILFFFFYYHLHIEYQLFLISNAFLIPLPTIMNASTISIMAKPGIRAK